MPDTLRRPLQSHIWFILYQYDEAGLNKGRAVSAGQTQHSLWSPPSAIQYLSNDLDARIVFTVRIITSDCLTDKVRVTKTRSLFTSVIHL